jgi:hypothetical protein
MFTPVRATVEGHLLAAAQYFADSATALDTGSAVSTSRSRSDRRSLVIGAVLTSVAFLEALLSASWDDLGKLNGSPESWFRPRKNLARLAALGVPDILKLPLLTRFELTLAVSTSPPLDTGRSPYQDVQALILLRNSISHHKTQWDLYDTENPGSRPKVIRNLERSLRGRFPENAYSKGRRLFFPDRCLSGGCARWAVKSARDFAIEFFSHLGVKTITEGVVRMTIERLANESRVT